MSRAGDEVEDLGTRVEEVENLGDEQQAEGFGEVAKYAYDGEDHAGKVAVSVADEYTSWVPVVGKQGARDADPGEKQVEREKMRVGGWMGIWGEEVQAIVEGKQRGDDNALGNLNAVNAGQHVDALRAKHGDTSHVYVVENAQVEEFAKVRLELKRDDDRGHVKVDKVNHKKRNRCKTRNPPLVTTADVEKVITDTEKSNGLKRDNGPEIGRELYDQLVLSSLTLRAGLY